ncbi:MAG TPA: hypothetical protein PKD09_15575, partial [Aggregatilinea sp.]|uniref:hypothetical protein n=1 Tax=Aggregatilinea sp. TaxID=2806333 RepID=UPI002C85068F
WAWAGGAAALAIACKPTTALCLPLVIALGLAATARVDWYSRDIMRRGRGLALALGSGVALLALWDLARAPRSFYTLAVARNAPGRLIRSDEIWPRLDAWGHWLAASVGTASLAAGIGLVVLIWLVAGLRRGRSRATTADWSIAGFTLAFIGWYWLVAFNTYDRYLHSLVPFLLLLAARAAIGLWRTVGARRVVAAAGAAALIVGLLPATMNTLRGETPLTDSRSTYTGIDRLADYLNTTLRGEIVYDHWLGWELAYYLGDDPGVRAVYMPLPDDLAGEMRQQTDVRYLAVPSAADAGPWLDALRRAEIDIRVVYSDPPHGFVVYALRAQS